MLAEKTTLLYLVRVVAVWIISCAELLREVVCFVFIQVFVEKFQHFLHPIKSTFHISVSIDIVMNVAGAVGARITKFTDKVTEIITLQELFVLVKPFVVFFDCGFFFFLTIYTATTDTTAAAAITAIIFFLPLK